MSEFKLLVIIKELLSFPDSASMAEAQRRVNKARDLLRNWKPE